MNICAQNCLFGGEMKQEIKNDNNNNKRCLGPEVNLISTTPDSCDYVLKYDYFLKASSVR